MPACILIVQWRDYVKVRFHSPFPLLLLSPVFLQPVCDHLTQLLLLYFIMKELDLANCMLPLLLLEEHNEISIGAIFHLNGTKLIKMMGFGLVLK